MQDLIDRLEQATGPDGALDAAIDCCVRFPDLRPAKPDDHLEHQNGIPPGANSIWCPTGFLMAAPYTSSIDAALTLLGDEYQWLVEDNSYRSHAPRAWCKPRSIRRPGFTGHGDTPAIAVCIAALRARASLSSTNSTEK